MDGGPGYIPFLPPIIAESSIYIGIEIGMTGVAMDTPLLAEWDHTHSIIVSMQYCTLLLCMIDLPSFDSKPIDTPIV